MPASGGLPTRVPIAKVAPPEFAAPASRPVSSDGWDTIVAAIHAISSMGQPILLTLTAKNMKPIWIDFHTRRFYMETVMSEIPAVPVGVKIFSHPVDPENPPYPWVAWKSLDGLLWNIGERAFVTGRALWLILGERYTLSRWPNLTEISYGVDDLRSISMLANGSITIDELALVARTSIEHSQKLISMLSLLGVLRGTGAPMVPTQLIEAAEETELEVQLRELPLETQQPPAEERFQELPSFFDQTEPVQETQTFENYQAPVEEYQNFENTPYVEVAQENPAEQFYIDNEAPVEVFSDDTLYEELPDRAPEEFFDEEPTLEAPPELNRGNQAMVSGPSFFEDEEKPDFAKKSAPLSVPGFEPPKISVPLQEFPSFSEIMKAAPQVEEEKVEEQQSTGLFGLLRKRLGKK